MLPDPHNSHSSRRIQEQRKAEPPTTLDSGLIFKVVSKVQDFLRHFPQEQNVQLHPAYAVQVWNINYSTLPGNPADPLAHARWYDFNWQVGLKDQRGDLIGHSRVCVSGKTSDDICLIEVARTSLARSVAAGLTAYESTYGELPSDTRLLIEPGRKLYCLWFVDGGAERFAPIQTASYGQPVRWADRAEITSLLQTATTGGLPPRP